MIFASIEHGIDLFDGMYSKYYKYNNIILKISMLIRCICEYLQKKIKVLTINKKMEILTNLENGMKNWEMCKKYNVSNSSALHSVVVGKEGSIVCSLWGGVTRS